MTHRRRVHEYPAKGRGQKWRAIERPTARQVRTYTHIQSAYARNTITQILGQDIG